MIGGAVCVRCGCDEIDYLEFNHINGGGSAEWRSNREDLGTYLGAADMILAGKRKTDDLNVMCRVCNALDYLSRKNPSGINRFTVRWENLTGEKVMKL